MVQASQHGTLDEAKKLKSSFKDQSPVKKIVNYHTFLSGYANSTFSGARSFQIPASWASER